MALIGGSFEVKCPGCHVSLPYREAEYSGWKPAGKDFSYACPKCSETLYYAHYAGGVNKERFLFATTPEIAVAAATKIRSISHGETMLMLHCIKDGSIQCHII